MIKKTKSKRGKDILEELLGDLNQTPETYESSVVLSDKFVIQKLTEKAEAGDIRALELLGKHLKIFDKDSEKGNELIDVFAEEGTIEDNILKFLDLMEDKYAEELAHAVPMLMDQTDLYLDEKEKQQLLRQLSHNHERNVERDQSEVINKKSPAYKEDLAPIDPFSPEAQEDATEMNIFG